MDHKGHLVMIVAHAYTPLLLLDEEACHRMVTHLDASIQPITGSKLTRTLTPHKLNNSEIDVSSLLDGVNLFSFPMTFACARQHKIFFNDGTLHK